MARLQNGLWGGVSGKIGNTVCYMVNGKQYVRMNRKSEQPPTPGQLVNRAEMALVSSFLKPFLKVLRIGFGKERKGQAGNAYSLAVSYTKKYALKGEKPNREIDVTRILLSKGGLAGVDDAEARLEDDLLQVTWQGQIPNGQSHARDQIMLVACFPDQEPDEVKVYHSLCGTDRCAGHGTLHLPATLMGRPVEVYLFAVSKDGKSVSNSQYLGRLG